MDPGTKENYLRIVREWLSKQQHLPQKINDTLLHRFLHCCNYSIEKAKVLIDLFFTVRSHTPEIFTDRDPKSPELLEIFQNFDFVPMPKLTDQNHKIFIYRINTPDPDKYHFIKALKVFFIFADVRMAIEEDIADGEIPIFDMANFTLKHLTKVNLAVLKKYMVYTQEAHPIKLKQIHLLNVPSFLDKCMAILRPFLKSEVAKMVHTHLPNSSTLNEYVPESHLPTEYGGTVGDIQDLKKWWVDKVMEHRDYIIDESRWTVDESKRAGDSGHDARNLLGMEGSFRSLVID
ncbi:alpha-tocopherol transfer protein-like [Anthonomus grandis grandis]|uniref:alpha-tocopherol transfer protein-like n=1 Tax=Anthonomus grandis grandis TaxID=2921223 RepID=UPI002164F099|nr:alpha-tocopherol transfer protein-like [Anthonomus grandis grandis]